MDIEQLVNDSQVVLSGTLNDYLQARYDDQALFPSPRSYATNQWIGTEDWQALQARLAEENQGAHALLAAARRVSEARYAADVSDALYAELVDAGVADVLYRASARVSTWLGEYQRGIEDQDRARHASWRRGVQVTRVEG